MLDAPVDGTTETAPEQAGAGAKLAAEGGSGPLELQAAQPSQMQHLAAAALASARSGSLGPGSQPGGSARSVPSMDFDATEMLPLSQELLDKPLACAGSTLLGAGEEEAALAALQGSRSVSQRSAQQQAEDAAQRAAHAIHAQHEAEVQAVLDMFTAEDFASPMMRGESSGDDSGGDGGPAGDAPGASHTYRCQYIAFTHIRFGFLFIHHASRSLFAMLSRPRLASSAVRGRGGGCRSIHSTGRR